MTTPKKLEILRKAKGISLERQIRAGLPAITPTEKELKETGAFHEAQIDLMRVDQSMLAEQEKYLKEMASEMGLKLVSGKMYRRYTRKVDAEFRLIQRRKKAEFEREKLRKLWLGSLEREKSLSKKTGYKWTNGWTKHKSKREKKPKPVTIPRVSLRKPLDIGSAIRGAPKPTIKMPSVKVPCPYCDELVTLNKRGLIPATHMIQHKRVKGKWISTAPKPIVKTVTKRKKSHVERAGKTMRALRKVNGVKVFAFPDDVWKVRKPRKRGKSRKRRQR